MHILLTNDDGITSVGIKALAEAALAAGHQVTVSAPTTQQSAQSHRITLSTPIFTDEFDMGENITAYAVHGSPADCVRIGKQLVDTPIDFCISGINNGWNAGSAVYYSGTVSAAREAAMLYLPSIATSIDVGANDEMRKGLAEISVSMAEKLQTRPLPRLCICSLNAPAIPVSEWKETALAPLDTAYFIDRYEQRQSPRGQKYFWLREDSGIENCVPGSDVDLLHKGHVTCTFLCGCADENKRYADII